jgi:hypothetical protein
MKIYDCSTGNLIATGEDFKIIHNHPLDKESEYQLRITSEGIACDKVVNGQIDQESIFWWDDLFPEGT